MQSVLKRVGNAALIVVGFFVVFFGVQKASDGGNTSHANLPGSLLDSEIGVAHADAPSCGCSGDSVSSSSSGDSGSSGDSSADSSGGGK